jgi:hypothetical protein
MVAIVVSGLTLAYSPKIQFHFGFNPSELSNKEEYSKLLSAREVTLPSLTQKAKTSQTSSLFEEDPLMGTEDIILPENEDENITNPPIQKPEVTGGEVKPVTTTDTDGKPATTGGFSGGFSGIEPLGEGENDQEDSEEPATTGGFSGGFDALSEPAADSEETPTTGGFSAGFDAMSEPAADSDNETDAEPASDKPADDEATDQEESSSDSPFESDAFGGL